MAVNIKKFGLEQQSKIMKRYEKYYDKVYHQWNIPSHEMKSIMTECWDLSHALNKHKHLDLDNILDNVKFTTMLNVKENYNKLSQTDFYKFIINLLRDLDDKQTL